MTLSSTFLGIFGNGLTNYLCTWRKAAKERLQNCGDRQVSEYVFDNYIHP